MVLKLCMVRISMQMCARKLAWTPKVIKKKKKKEDEHADADYICIYNSDNNYGP